MALATLLAMAVGLAALVAVALALVSCQQRREAKQHCAATNIPSAKGAWPLLGHAVAFRRAPDQFVAEQCRSVGPIFRVNLAGKRMVVVARSPQLLRQVAWQPERVLSAREAVAMVGFEQMLGAFSVRRGTDLHRTILKDMLRADHGGLAAHLPRLLASLRAAAMLELQRLGDAGGRSSSTTPAAVRVPDLLAFVRRCVLRATVERLLGSAFLRVAGSGFLDEFTAFQDAVEEATAKAAVLARRVALPLVLWPVQRWRERLAASVVQYLRAAHTETNAASLSGAVDHTTDQPLGPWLQHIMGEETGLMPDDAAQLVLSLLFAAHKNPAIGAAQVRGGVVMCGVGLRWEVWWGVEGCVVHRGWLTCGMPRRCVFMQWRAHA
jgi:hypothetical protein